MRGAIVLFADFNGFTTLAERVELATLLGLLDTYFTAFDDITAGVLIGGRRHRSMHALLLAKCTQESPE
jgi:hypothetical protein